VASSVALIASFTASRRRGNCGDEQCRDSAAILASSDLAPAQGHCTNRTITMGPGSQVLIWAAVLAVFLVLLAGLWNMLRGTSPNLSQTLMRWRVGLQFLAILLMMALIYLWRQ
jgi:Hypoxia induced protein conserved region